MRVGVLIGLSLPDKGIDFQATANYAANLHEARRSGFQDSGRGAGIQAALEIAAEPRPTFRSNGALRQFGSGPSPKPLSCDSTSPVIPTIALIAMGR